MSADRATTDEPAAAPHPGRVLGALANPTRLAVLAAVVLSVEPAGAVAVAAASRTSPEQTAKALSFLEAAGVVRVSDRSEPDAPSWEAVPSAFARAARAVASMRAEVAPEDLGATAEQAVVLRKFLTDGRLSALPARASERSVVLDFVAQRFEPGRRYLESEVNRSLGRLCDDHASLRRALVDAGLLERADRRYWRSGGTFEVDRD